MPALRAQETSPLRVEPFAAARPHVSLAMQVLVCLLLSVGAAQFTGASDSAEHLITFLVVASLGVGAAVVGAWRHRGTLGLVGGLLVAALCCWYVADAGWVFNVLVLNVEPFPAWTDGFFLLTYPALVGAGMLVVRRREVRRDLAAVIDALIITVGVAVVAYAFIFVDATANSTGAAQVVGAMYPLCDVLAVGVVARLLVGSATLSRAALLMVAGICSLLVADLGFVAAVFAGAEASYEGWIDAAYLMFFLLVGLALLQNDAADLVKPGDATLNHVGRLRMAALGAGALLAPMTLLIGDVAGEPIKVRGAAVGAAVLFLLAMIRVRQLIRAVETKSDLLEVLARTDPLTGLPNRRSFDFELQRAAARKHANSPVGPLSVAMIDLDQFKSYNDTHGHTGGDELLKQAAHAWANELNAHAPHATIARYGGEEFAVILPGITEDAAADTLRAVLAVTPKGQTFSAGVAQQGHDEPPQATLTRADHRLYEAKLTGRARVIATHPLDQAGSPAA
jgi:diguanylate cyclase (GGDEF)-like protein